ncbi:uncharacterized protein LOC124366020 isoform X2 [Homalodisca vitripennis]|uniref:uncharacterized protein LOC124366020 isoform X2 n=1 Tax=Homalodisca vitripennis TaxID=197043 RepID=UPI001EEBA40D|nr:uncharacterized protein LOC124366020 isoform X2 [Homalodisca vitripennis]KAG8254156.1 hypothetical protein J6590_015039 [Homalodisca vitripennis]
MEENEIAELLDCDISFEQTIFSDIEGDSDTEDNLVTTFSTRRTSTPIPSPVTSTETQTPGNDVTETGTIIRNQTSEFPPSSALSGTDTPNPELNIGLTCGLSPITPSTSKCVTRKRKPVNKTHMSILTDSSSDSNMYDSDADPEFIPDPDRGLRNKRKRRFPLIYCTESSDDELEQKKLRPSLDIGNENAIIIGPKANTNSNNTKPKQFSKKHISSKYKNTMPTVKNQKGKKYHWKKIANNPNKFTSYEYKQKFGLNVTLPSHEPSDIFKLIFDNEICTTIVQQSNLYALQQKTTLDLTLPELDAFFGLQAYHQ